MRINNNKLQPLLLCAVFGLLSAQSAQAERADRPKPINMLAAKLEIDDAKGERVATGDVLIAKGSILIRADKAVVREDAQGYQHVWLSAKPGQRVFFRERRDGADDEFIEAEAQAIQYDGQHDAVTLNGRGELRHYRGTTLAGELLAEHISYDDAAGRFVAQNPVPAEAAVPGHRVRVMLVPR
jgi:lipopolysaccharide export system protein LptA